MAPQKSPAFSFYAKDFLTGTSTMSLQEVGAYIRLLSYQWDVGSIPVDARERARILGCAKAQERELWKKVGQKFALRDDAYFNERLEEERVKQVERRRRLSDNGKLGGRPTKANGKLDESKSFTETEANGKQLKSLPSSSSYKEQKNASTTLTQKRNGFSEYEHPRFDVPTWWHLENVKGLSGGESRMMQFYRWLAARVERTNEDTLPRKEWLNRCFAEWLAEGRVSASSVPSPADTARMIAERMAKAGK